MYEPYPGGVQMAQRPRTQPPRSVTVSVLLMFTGAAVSLVALFFNIRGLDALKSQVRATHPFYTTAQVNGSVHASVGSIVFGALFDTAVWILVALMCKGGKEWARIMATVLFGIFTLSIGVALGLRAAFPFYRDFLPVWFDILFWLIALAATVPLWVRPSMDYFKGTRQP
jgi:hypothetical protein